MTISRMKDVLERERPRGRKANYIFLVFHRWDNQSRSQDWEWKAQRILYQFQHSCDSSKSNGENDPPKNNFEIFLGLPDLANEMQEGQFNFNFRLKNKTMNFCFKWALNIAWDVFVLKIYYFLKSEIQI